MLTELPSELLLEHIYPYLTGKSVQQIYRSYKSTLPSYTVIDAYIRDWNKLSLVKRVALILKTQHQWHIHIISSLDTPITKQISFASCKESLPSTEHIYMNGFRKIKIWITVYDALGVILNESAPDTFVNTIHLNVYRNYYVGSSILRAILPSLNKVIFQLHQPEIESGAHPWKG